MTPVDKNNEPLDAILRRAMRESPGPATPECADAESLAAYSDRSLAPAERERLEAHFADCMRCQVLLAHIAHADESARNAKSASEVPWYRRWRIAIPALAAAAAAAVIFIAIRRPANDEAQRDQLVAMAKRAAPAAELAAPAPAPVPAVPVPAAAPASNEIAMNEPKSEAPRAQAMNANAPRTLSRRAEAAGEGAMIAQGGAAGAKTGAKESFGAAVAGNAMSSSAGYAIEAGVLATISPADRSVTWLIGKNGMIRRQDARGGTQVQRSGVGTDLVAGAAPSSTVCWLVGRNGTVIRTTDGEHWAAVPAPTTENFVAVSSDSANDATITTANGKSFTTSDGGTTWHQQ